MECKFDPIEEVIEEVKKGHIVIMQDPESRENEGDYICAAEFATPENILIIKMPAQEFLQKPVR